MVKDSIYNLLLDLLNLQVIEEDRLLYCPLTDSVFICDGKYIKVYTEEELANGVKLDKRSETLFYPINNYRLIERLFQFFLCTLRDYEDVTIDNVVRLPPDTLKRSEIYIMYEEDYSKLYSDRFKNVCLCFIDIIFKYNSINVDLHPFDTI